jgi:hypothetical protein
MGIFRSKLFVDHGKICHVTAFGRLATATIERRSPRRRFSRTAELLRRAGPMVATGASP